MGNVISSITLDYVLQLIKEGVEDYKYHICGSNGGDGVFYDIEVSESQHIQFTNHGYIDMNGLKPYVNESHGLYRPRLYVNDNQVKVV